MSTKRDDKSWQKELLEKGVRDSQRWCLQTFKAVLKLNNMIFSGLR